MCTQAGPLAFKLLPGQGSLQGEKPSEPEQLLRLPLGKQTHHSPDRGAGSLKSSLICSSTSWTLPAPFILAGFSTCTASFPVHILQETFPDEPIRPTCSLLSYDFYTWITAPTIPSAPPQQRGPELSLPIPTSSKRALFGGSGKHWPPRFPPRLCAQQGPSFLAA